MPQPRKTFLLGAGCQKGGTTWLYNHLKKSRELAHGYRKEYHVLDSLELASEDWMRRRVLRQAEESLAALQRGEPADADVIHRASMLADPEHYYDYFTGLLRRAPRFRAAADMTPDHAMLPASRLAAVRDGLERRGVRTVSVFLMRDPVERTWSQIRMQADRDPTRFAVPTEQVLAERHAEPVYELRSRYGDTIAALDEVFDPADVHYGFYESLFTEDAVRRVTDLLGMEHVAPDLGTRRNASRRTTPGLDDDVARQVALHYAPTYRAVADRFPDVDLIALWPHSRHVLG